MIVLHKLGDHEIILDNVEFSQFVFFWLIDLWEWMRRRSFLREMKLRIVMRGKEMIGVFFFLRWWWYRDGVQKS